MQEIAKIKKKESRQQAAWLYYKTDVTCLTQLSRDIYTAVDPVSPRPFGVRVDKNVLCFKCH